MFLFTPYVLLTLSLTELEILFKAAHIRLHRSHAGSLERAKALAEIENVIRAMNLKRAKRREKGAAAC